MLGDVYIKPVSNNLYKWVVVHEFPNGTANLNEIGGRYKMNNIYLPSLVKVNSFYITNKANFERFYEVIGWKNIYINSKSLDPLNKYKQFLKIKSGVNFVNMTPFCMRILSPYDDLNLRMALMLKEILNCDFIL